MTKITLTSVGDLRNTVTAQTAINNNFATIQSAIDNTLSRDGTSPNTISNNIDMDSFRILNLPAAMTVDEPLRLQDLMDFVGGSLTLAPIPTGGTLNQALVKNSSTDYDVSWQTQLGAPGGANTQLQYNNAGTLGGITGATTNGTFVTLTTPVIGAATGTSLSITPANTNAGFTSTHASTGSPLASTKLNRINVTSDNADAGGGILSAAAIDHSFGGSATTKGGRSGLSIGLTLTAPTNATNTFPKHAGMISGVTMNNNENGTNTGAGARGRAMGVNGYAFANNSSATNLEAIIGISGDVFTATGSTLKDRIAINALEEGSVVQGAGTDAAFAASALAGAVGFKQGLSFSNYQGQGPVATTGTLIGTVGASTVAKGIDWSSYTFTGNQITGTGFSVGSTGLAMFNKGAGAGLFDVAGSTSGFLLQGPDSGEARMDLIAGNADAVIVFRRFNGNTTSSPANLTKVVSGNQIMGLVSLGLDTNANATFQQGGSIGSYATADWSSTSHPTEFRFFTIPTGSTSIFETVRMLSDGGMWTTRNTVAPKTVLISGGNTTPVFQTTGADNSNGIIVQDVFGVSGGSGMRPYLVQRSARGSASGTFTATQLGDPLGGFAMVGCYQNNTFADADVGFTTGGAFMIAQATENWSAGGQGASIIFFTQPTGSVSTVKASAFNSSGSLSVGTSAAAKDFGLGNLYLAGGIATNAAAAAKTANYTMTVADADIIFNGAGTLTLTLLAAGTYPGREVWVKTYAAQLVNSATSNVVPKGGGAAGTAILPATIAAWAKLKSNGTNWEIMASGT